jgi:hypothetical protein
MGYVLVGLVVVNALFFLGLLGRFVELRQTIRFSDSSRYVAIAKRRCGAAFIWAAAITTISITILSK